MPDSFKLRGLDEKFILKRFARGRVPQRVLDRPKFPYRAPVAEALVGKSAPPWAEELLSAKTVNAAGVFDGARWRSSSPSCARAAARRRRPTRWR